MREYRTSSELYQDSKSVEEGGNLLEKVLSDAKPVVPSTVDNRYEISSRPTELSTGGYVDITD
ncbi:MAG TPA: hypothetical protein PK255_02370 [Candidatus Pacearchaeota archaeon]|nr:hypothetical protein [Candidatus Pacearchaeota archaeon]HQF83013.1 hypothetical protein [Candidatus Pacearchaeota archaeon]HQI57990.1 hypothetical protein [Candidatus Pacearchaeota archaeon]HQJ57905.1 hypothetical protein [Candidatus Pacearchaeota archaeon]